MDKEAGQVCLQKHR